MDSQTSLPTLTSSLAPFPPVPIELKGHILSFCDTPTLAAASRCSFAFLELASPLLYETVEISGMQQLARLLCATADHPLPHLARYLSLTQIKTLSFRQAVWEERASESESRKRLSTPARLPLHPFPPLPLAELNISVMDHSSWNRDPRGFERSTRSVLEGLLVFFNPTRFTLENRGPLLEERNEEDEDVPFTITFSAALSRWIKIREFKLINAFPNQPLVRCPFLAVGTDRRVNVAYDLRGMEGSGSEALDCLVSDLLPWDGSASEGERRQGAKKIKHIRVVLDTERERQDVLAEIRGSILFDRITVVVRA